MHGIRLGTCSWKYQSWRNIVYPPSLKEQQYLAEYAKHYRTVEVDQWFWSLFKKDNVVLPKPDVVEEYCAAVDDEFRFSIKAANAITLTHHYHHGGKGALIPNPHFLSPELTARFLDRLAPMAAKTHAVMFQFGYLNKEKMAGWHEFLARLDTYVTSLPSGFHYGIECRNPNFLNHHYFAFLQEKELIPVLLQGYYMPSIFTLLEKFDHLLGERIIIRLHGPERQEIERRTGKDWSQRVVKREGELRQLATTVRHLTDDGREVVIYVNNHFEGSAPRTISRFKEILQEVK